MWQVAATKEPTSREIEETAATSASIASQQCLFLNSDDRSEALEKLLRDKFDLLSGKGLEKNIELGPSAVLGLLGESLAERGGSISELVCNEDEMPNYDVVRFLRSESKQKGGGGANKRHFCDVERKALGGLPMESVVFQCESKSRRLCSAGCELVGMSVAGQLFPVSSRLDNTDYETLELESIVRRRTNEQIGTNIYRAGAMEFTSVSGNAKQYGVSTGRTNFHPPDSARILSKVCFAKVLPKNSIPISRILGGRQRKQFNLPAWLV